MSDPVPTPTQQCDCDKCGPSCDCTTCACSDCTCHSCQH